MSIKKTSIAARLFSLPGVTGARMLKPGQGKQKGNSGNTNEAQDTYE